MNTNSHRTVMPIITVDSVDDVRSFYVERLGFDHMMGVLGKDGQLDFCTVVLGGAKLMFSRPQEKVEGTKPSTSRRPVEIYFEVRDVDGYHAQLKKRGVNIISSPNTEWWGDRVFKVMDPYGYQIWFYETVAEPKPPQGAKIV
jgi:PhnB protein